MLEWIKARLREGNTWQGIILAMVGAVLLAPDLAAHIVARLQGARDVLGAAGDAAVAGTSLYLVIKEQKR
jgi:hypothetical protein